MKLILGARSFSVITLINPNKCGLQLPSGFNKIRIAEYKISNKHSYGGLGMLSGYFGVGLSDLAVSASVIRMMYFVWAARVEDIEMVRVHECRQADG